MAWIRQFKFRAPPFREQCGAAKAEQGRIRPRKREIGSIKYHPGALRPADWATWASKAWRFWWMAERPEFLEGFVGLAEADCNGPGSQFHAIREPLEILPLELEVTDDDGVRRLLASCRDLAPDCTEEEIAYFIQVKAEQARSGQLTIRNLMGFLQTAVPQCLAGAAFQHFRSEQARKREGDERQQILAEAENARLLAEQRAILDDPNASEEDQRFARQILHIPEGEKPPAE